MLGWAGKRLRTTGRQNKSGKKLAKEKGPVEFVIGEYKLFKSMVRFYKYIIYRLYTWRLKKNDDTPGTTVELLMCIPHYCHLLTLYAIVTYFLPKLDSNFNNLQILFIALEFQLLYHLLIYNKKRWRHYMVEFENETTVQRKRGTLLIWVYVIGSIALFFISVPLLFLAKQ